MSNFSDWLNGSLIFSLVMLLFIAYTKQKYKPALTLFTVFINVVITSCIAFFALFQSEIHVSIFNSTFWGAIPVEIDGLSGWFVLIINFTALTGIFYGSGYLKAYDSANSKMSMHFIAYILFHLSMIWVTLLHHSIAFLIAWELMSLSSMVLVIFDHQKLSTLKAGINYLVQMHISVIFLTVGFIWVYFETGSFSFDAIAIFFNSNSNLWLFFVFFIGFGIKAGFVPLHSWLPHAHPEAPSHVSGVMSGVIVKLGIYGIFRVISFLKADFLLLGEIVLSISVITGIYGILNSAIHRDFKRMLAYCTIENIGIIGIGIGLGLMGIGNNLPLLYYLGFGGALLHVLNHSLFKSLLFFAAGSVYQQTHTRDMEKLGGLIKTMPKTAVLFLIGAIAIAGIPPFNGFVSEFILYSGLLSALNIADITQILLLVLSLAGLSLIGGLSVLAFTKSFGTIFLGNERTPLNNNVKEVSKMMLIPQYLIIAVMLSVAFFPHFYLNTLALILENLLTNSDFIVPIELNKYALQIANINLYSLLFISIVAVMWFFRAYILKNKINKLQPTWGCGYSAPNAQMQYTGKSFSKSLGKIFNLVLIEQKKFKELKKGELFPKNRQYNSYYFDFFEYRFIHGITHRLVYSLNYFKFIQNGRIQSYVFYGLVFMLTIFILTVLNILK